MQSWQPSRNRKRSVRNADSASDAAAAICLQLVDASLFGILFVAPLFFGGRDPLGRLIFILFACTAGVAWFVRQSLLSSSPQWTRSWAPVIGLSSVALVAGQLLPLPSGLLQWLAPRNSALLTLGMSGSESSPQLGAWNTLSLAPSDTKLALATLIAYSLLFFAAVGRLRQLADIQRLMKWIAISSIGMSLFGLVQYFTSNGLFFWFYEYPYSSTLFPAKGSFTTSNHFAHFLVLGLGPLLAWIVLRLHRQGDDRGSAPPASTTTLLLYFSVVVVVFAVLLSVSRGGALALAVSSTVLVAIYLRQGLVSSLYLYGLVAAGVLVVGMLSVYGYDEVARRLDDFAAGSVEDLDHHAGRRRIWSANLAAIQQGGLFGSGAGSHREIYPVYLTEPAEVEYTHAENGYLQIATENGVLGIALLAVSLLVIGSWCWRANCYSASNDQRILAGAISACLAASLVHSLVDFVWFIPACMSLTVLLLACLLRLSQLENKPDRSQVSWPRERWWGTATVATLTTLWAFSIAIGPGTAAIDDCNYRLTAVTNTARVLEKLKANEEPASQELGEQQLLTETMIFQLRKVLSRDPASARAHLRLAGRYLSLFAEQQRDTDNSMSLDQIRDAVFASQFRTSKELRNWLHLAFGKNSELLYRAHFHARRSLQLCPLLGDAYVDLASLCFLEGQSAAKANVYLSQAERLRPFDYNLLYDIGEQRIQLREGEQLKQAEELWIRIFRHPGTHQLKIIRYLAGHSPAPVFLHRFAPDWLTLPYVWQRYRLLGNTNDWRILVQYGLTIAKRDCPDQTPYQAARIWHALASMQREIGDLDGVLSSYQQAYRVAPNIYWVRRELGRSLVRAGYYQEAEPHLRWCQSRHPEEEQLKNELILATKSRLRKAEAPSQGSRYQ